MTTSPRVEESRLRQRRRALDKARTAKRHRDAERRRGHVRSLRERLAESEKRERELYRAYRRAYKRASGLSERASVAAITEAFDAADAAQRAYLGARATTRQLQRKLRAVRA